MIDKISMDITESTTGSSAIRAQGEVAKGRLVAGGGLSCAALASGGVLPAVCLVQISKQFQLSDAQCGLFFAVAPTVTLVTLPMFGQLSERWGKRGLLALGMALLAVAMAFYQAASDFSFLLLGSAALGLSCSIIDALVSPLMVDLYPRRTAPVMNLVHCCFQIGIVITAIGGGAYLARQGLWTSTFFPVMLLGGAVCLLFAFTRFPEPQVHAEPLRIGGLLTQSSFWLCSIVIGVAGGVEAGILGWVPTFLQRQFNMASAGNWLVSRYGFTNPEPLLGGFGLALFAAPMVVGRWFYGALAERFGYVQILLASCTISAAALLGLWQANSAATSVLWLALLGLALSGVWPTLLIYAGTIIRANPQTLFALLAMAGLAGVGICSWGVGQLADSFGGIHVGLCALVFPLLAAMLALVVLARSA